MNIATICFVIAVTFQLVYADSIATVSVGPCPTIDANPSFNAQSYVGTWYEIKRFPVFYEYGMKCVKADYGTINTSMISVKNTGVKSSGAISSVEGTASAPDASAPNKLIVQFPRNIFGINLGSNKGAYNVLDTDYQTYSVVYSCWNDPLKIMKIESAWILARSRTLDATNLDKALSALKKLNIKTENFIDTDQSGCQ